MKLMVVQRLDKLDKGRSLSRHGTHEDLCHRLHLSSYTPRVRSTHILILTMSEYFKRKANDVTAIYDTRNHPIVKGQRRTAPALHINVK